MKKLTILSSLLLLALNSCSNEELFNEEILPSYEKRITVVAEDLTPAEGTRTSYTDNGNGYSFAWTEGDALGIFPTNGHQTDFPIGEDGVGSNTAVFNGGDWALKPNAKYAAYYPLIEDFKLDPTAIPVVYTGQVQIGNGNTDHLCKYDYMASSFTEVDDKGNVNFQMKHLGCLVQFKLTMPEADTYSEFIIESNDAIFITSGTYNLLDKSHVLENEQEERCISIGLSNVSTTETNKTLGITAMFAPVDLSNSTLTLKVEGKKHSYIVEVEGQDLTQGTVVRNISNSFVTNDIPYVTFHADAEQTLSMSKEVATLEYSVNNGMWTTLGTNAVTFGGGNGDLRLRGKSIFGTSNSEGSSVISFSNYRVEVACSGDIRTLVDFEQYEDVDTSNARFRYLFSNNAQLINSPDLPATVLADHCYESMFFNCYNLSEAPILPAQKLQTGCYNGMFYGCSNINYVKTKAENLHISYCEEWLDECSDFGIVEKIINWDFEETGYVPFGWSVKYIDSNNNVVNYPDYITFSSLRNQTLQLINGNSVYNGPLEYSLKNGEWKLLGSDIIEFGGTKGDLRLRKNNNLGTVGSFVFGEDASVQCSGDIRTLIDYKHFSDDICGSFSSLFKNCVQLEKAPQLPSKNLNHEGCYSEMFKGCSSLVQAPALPAKKLSRLCYYAMFEDCISLSQAPNLSAMELSDWCYVRMFNGCSSLAQAPTLPATRLKDTCYGSMFKNCITLENAPELPSETLVEACYSNMFEGCTSLNYIKMMATDVSAYSCLYNWLSGVSTTGTFVKNSAATWSKTGSSGIPSGWTVTTADH